MDSLTSKQEIARQLREWYESGWIRGNTLKQKQAELLWAAIGSLTADEPTSARASNEQLAQALRNLRDVAHREVSPRYSAALDKAFTLADIALGEFDSEGDVSREADVGPGGGVRATHATGSAPSKPGAAEPPPDTRDMWICQALPLIEAIADWERTNGTASSLVNDAERRGVAKIVERWTLSHNARGLVEMVKPAVTKDAGECGACDKPGERR